MQRDHVFGWTDVGMTLQGINDWFSYPTRTISPGTLFLWKDAGVIKYRSTIRSQADFRIQLKWQQINCVLTEKGYKSYLEKLDNLSLTTKESEVKDTSEEINQSISRNVIMFWGFYLWKWTEFNTGCIMYGISFHFLLCVLNNFI